MTSLKSFLLWEYLYLSLLRLGKTPTDLSNSSVKDLAVTVTVRSSEHFLEKQIDPTYTGC